MGVALRHCSVRLVVPVAVLMVLSAAGGSAAARSASTTAAAFRDGRVLVAFRSGSSSSVRQADDAAVGGRVMRSFTGGIQLISVPAGMSCRRLPRCGVEDMCVLSSRTIVMHEDGVPNDPSFGLQWGHRNTGQSVNGVTGTSGADERSVAAWGVTTGSRSIVIGEIDSGVDYNHPDLAANIWTTRAASAAARAAYARLQRPHAHLRTRWTTTRSTAGTAPTSRESWAPSATTGSASRGVNWPTSILPVKWLTPAGTGETSGLISALNWVAASHAAGVNIRVVNDSATFVGTAYLTGAVGRDRPARAEQHPFRDRRRQHGRQQRQNVSAPIRAAMTGRPRFALRHEQPSDPLPNWANYGPNTVDLAAPGDNSTRRSATGPTATSAAARWPRRRSQARPR